MSNLKVVDCESVPSDTEEKTAYRFPPQDPSDRFYHERTNRNLGWITKDEQNMLRQMTIGIAGCGGMGGLVAQIFLRLGVGEVRIADCEVFDESNLNRQFGALQGTVGKSKALETARLLRATCADTSLVVYPEGIDDHTVDHFLEGCNVVCDEIEFWAIGARILLHTSARSHGLTVFNCNTIGFGTRLFMFTPESSTMDECLGFTYEEARQLQQKVQNGTATVEERRTVMDSMNHNLVPEEPNYFSQQDKEKDPVTHQRLMEEGKASIIATNPPMASGFLADRVLLHLLEQSPVARSFKRTPPTPSYLYFDAAFMQAKIVERESW